MKKQKKGMSPLIATVLLIGFAVALAAIVMTWGLDFIRGQTGRVDDATEEALLCVNQLDFKVDVDCAQNLVGIDNRGSVEITELRLRKHMASGDVTPVQVTQPLASGEKKWFSDLDPLNSVLKVDVVATIVGSSGSPILCSSAIREREANCPP